MYGVLWDAWTALNSLSFSSTSWYVLQMYIKEAEKKPFNWKSDILLCPWTNYLGREIFHLAKTHTLWENSEPWFARCCTHRSWVAKIRSLSTFFSTWATGDWGHTVSLCFREDWKLSSGQMHFKWLLWWLASWQFWYGELVWMVDWPESGKMPMKDLG